MSLLIQALIVNDNLDIVDKLNRMLELDPVFTKNIVNTRHLVNQEYQDSGFVYLQEQDETCHTGLLGVLNSLIKRNDIYRVSGQYNDADELIGFCLIELNSYGKWEEVK